MAKSDASQMMRVSRSGSKTFNTGALHKSFLRVLKALSYASVQLNTTFLRVKEVSGLAISPNL